MAEASLENRTQPDERTTPGERSGGGAGDNQGQDHDILCPHLKHLEIESCGRSLPDDFLPNLLKLARGRAELSHRLQSFTYRDTIPIFELVSEDEFQELYQYIDNINVEEVDDGSLLSFWDSHTLRMPAHFDNMLATSSKRCHSINMLTDTH